jgi:hypothetical protein
MNPYVTSGSHVVLNKLEFNKITCAVVREQGSLAVAPQFESSNDPLASETAQQLHSLFMWQECGYEQNQQTECRQYEQCEVQSIREQHL